MAITASLASSLKKGERMNDILDDVDGGLDRCDFESR